MRTIGVGEHQLVSAIRIVVHFVRDRHAVVQDSLAVGRKASSRLIELGSVSQLLPIGSVGTRVRSRSQSPRSVFSLKTIQPYVVQFSGQLGGGISWDR